MAPLLPLQQMPLAALWVAGGLCFAPSIPAQVETLAEQALDFNRDIKPLLTENCFLCHGPDSGTREAELRLDRLEDATATLPSGVRAIVPGDVGASALVQRISAADSGERMPPAHSDRSLTDEEIDRLTRWIEQGAEWELHWSFQKPERSATPQARRNDWTRNTLDAFILARLEREGLAPEAEADRATLLRRLSLDLTGLPPTREELARFRADDRPGAYEREVERLFASPRYGEHMARTWLDAARYADTHGLHLDNARSMWPYRDWVVSAFNGNMPFDRFTIEQLAGDLLEDPTPQQVIASGFNRCNPTSAEGGMIADEYLAIYAKDRVDTTSTVFLGLTMGCAQCHDHKYDPITQRDYYQMLAFFNSLAEEASDRNIENPVPFVRVMSDEDQARLNTFVQQQQELEARLNAPDEKMDQAQVQWEQDTRTEIDARWQILVPLALEARSGARFEVSDQGVIEVDGENPARDLYTLIFDVPTAGISALRLEAFMDERQHEQRPGRAPNGNFVLTGVSVEVAPGELPGESRPAELTRAEASYSQDKYPVEYALDGKSETGWAGLGYEGDRRAIFAFGQTEGFEGGTRLTLRLAFESEFPQHALGRFRLAWTDAPEMAAVTLGSWHASGAYAAEALNDTHAAVFAPEKGYDVDARDPAGARIWSDRSADEDGKTHNLGPDVGARYLHRTITSPSERTLRVGLGSDDSLKVWLNGELLLDNDVRRAVALDQEFVELPLRAGANELLLKIVNYGGGFAYAFRVDRDQAGPLSAKVENALVATDARSIESRRETLRDHFRSQHVPEWQAMRQELDEVRTQHQEFEQSRPTTMVSREREERRPAHVLMRGDYEQPGEEVEAATPVSLPPLPAGAPRNRLGLAQWLVSPEQPLTSRVIANRQWQHFFGIGLVETSEDFGAQGQWPSHKELLDWLAVELQANDWDLRHLQRLMVTSATYRQASRVEPEKLEHDPRNRLLARGVRHRLDGEVLRDQALYLSGLLNEDMGGPGVKPFQPAGIWKAVGYTRSNTANFRQDSGKDLYRRSIYTFWKRTAPPPNLITFDSPNRESCSVRRARTNTPLQALVLLNDPQFVEAARFLGERILREGGEDDAARVRWAFEHVTGRAPETGEVELLTGYVSGERERFGADAEAAQQLLGVGDKPRDESLEGVEHASVTLLASLLLNLDETINKR